MVIQRVWAQSAPSHAVLPFPSGPWTLHFLFIFSTSQDQIKEVSPCSLVQQLLPHQASFLLLALSCQQYTCIIPDRNQQRRGPRQSAECTLNRAQGCGHLGTGSLGKGCILSDCELNKEVYKKQQQQIHGRFDLLLQDLYKTLPDGVFIRIP